MVPVYPGAVDLSDMWLPEGKRLLNYHAPVAFPSKAVLELYQNEMQGRGWRIIKPAIYPHMEDWTASRIYTNRSLGRGQIDLGVMQSLTLVFTDPQQRYLLYVAAEDLSQMTPEAQRLHGYRPQHQFVTVSLKQAEPSDFTLPPPVPPAPQSWWQRLWEALLP